MDARALRCSNHVVILKPSVIGTLSFFFEANGEFPHIRCVANVRQQTMRSFLSLLLPDASAQQCSFDTKVIRSTLCTQQASLDNTHMFQQSICRSSLCFKETPRMPQKPTQAFSLSFSNNQMFDAPLSFSSQEVTVTLSETQSFHFWLKGHKLKLRLRA